MCKYEMDPMSIIEDTERTRFCPQTDRRTDGQTDKVIPVYPPFNFVEAGGIIIHFLISYIDGLMQERCNSIANALELHLSCTNPSISLSHYNGTRGMPPISHCWGYFSRYPVMLWSLCNSFEASTPSDFIYGCLVFKWVALTWLKDRAPGQ